MKKALICGVSGQDGAYFAELLIGKGYEVYGTSCDAQIGSFRKLNLLGITDKVKVMSMAINDFRSVLQVIDRVKPDEIYNLSGQSSVALSFEQPVETLESMAIGTLNPRYSLSDQNIRAISHLISSVRKHHFLRKTHLISCFII